MPPTDNPLKLLIVSFADAFAQWLLGSRPRLVRPLNVDLGNGKKIIIPKVNFHNRKQLANVTVFARCLSFCGYKKQRMVCIRHMALILG